ncbi:MAG: hypothetical protein U0324_39690 [Polyangiales bacterium]
MRRSWHSPKRWGAVALPAALALAGCTGDGGEGVSRSAPFNRGRQLAISDQLHNGGTGGFVFLPPMVPRPAYFGDFMPDLEPVVRIDEVRADGTTVRTLATFTRDSGPNRERIRVHYQGRACDDDDDDGDNDPNGYFYARWFTDNANLSTSAVYRVRVFVQERIHPCTRPGWGRACRHGEDNTAPMREIGYADVDVVRNEREARFVDRDEFVPLVNGRSLRIKFRIDRPVVDADGDGVYNWNDNCRNTPNRDQRDTNRDGEGDACECLGVTCATGDACHAAGVCNPATGLCSNPSSPDGTACPLANASGACASGACGVAACNPGFANCDGNAANGCETSATTVANCGACGNACAAAPHASPACAAGACRLTCDAGWYDADGNAANGCELDVTTDSDCGRPGNACVSGDGNVTTCVAGACSTVACAAGSANCNGAVGDGCEVSLDADANHCGACGHACSVPNAAAACAGGLCAVGTCNAGFADCNGAAADGCEVTLGTDVSNCGRCGAACVLPHASPVCAAGACAVGTCADGFADVDGVAANGCEVDLATDPRHCGAVGNACSAPNGTAGCAAGACTVAACNAGFSDCDGNAANGCEVNTQTSPSHCGACNHACPSGAHSSATCGAGACGIACQAGFADCDGDATNGCEVDLQADGANCGACGTSCTQGRTCQSGACSAAVCAAGRANCNGAEGDGCEVTLAGDVSNCGACGNACSFTHAAAECTAGACGFSVCDVGFADVDGAAANGCEVDLTTSTQHCGAVNHACAPGEGCASGVCVSLCGPVASFADDFNRADGPVGNCYVTYPALVGEATLRSNRACGDAQSLAVQRVSSAGTNTLLSFDWSADNATGLETSAVVLQDDGGPAPSLLLIAGVDGGSSPQRLTIRSVLTNTTIAGPLNVALSAGVRYHLDASFGASGAVSVSLRVASSGALVGSVAGSVAGGLAFNRAGFVTGRGADGAYTCVDDLALSQGSCYAGSTRCGDACVDTQTSASHCGACGNACPSGQTCAAGSCVTPCAAGLTACGAACIDTRGDAANCGACGNACPAGRVCAAGSCVTAWGRSFPGRVRRMARDASGNLYVLLNVTSSTAAAATTGPVVLPTGSVTPNCGFTFCPDYVLVALDASGNGRWHRHVNTVGNDLFGDLAVDGLGNVYLTHNYQGSGTFPGGSLAAPPAGEWNSYILSYDSAGTYRWHRVFARSASSGLRGALAADASGNAYFMGTLNGPTGAVDFGGGNVASPGTSPNDFFLASYGPTGAYRWARRYGPTSGALFVAPFLATDAAGNVYGAATLSSATAPIAFGSLSLSPGGTNGNDVLLWSHDTTGALRFARSLTGAANEQVARVATTSGGDVYTLFNTAGVRSVRAFTAAGTDRWNTPITSGDIASVATDAAGNVFSCGGASNTVDFGGGATSGGAYDPYVRSATGAGAFRFALRGSGVVTGAVDVVAGGGAVCTATAEPSTTGTLSFGGATASLGTLATTTGLFCFSSN